MSHVLNKVKNILVKHPVLRGMVTYSLLWPASNFVQQSMDKSRTKFEPAEMFRYFILGTFATAPTVYVWVKTAGMLVEGTTFAHCMFKGILDVAIFAPIGQTQFYLGINLLEGHSWEECVAEWRKKLMPTWKVAAFFWPIVQTFNFAYVPERNRVMVVSGASFLWTIFLSYMHHASPGSLPKFLENKKRAGFVWKFSCPVLVGAGQVIGKAPDPELKASNATQQTLDSKRRQFNPFECLRFGILNSLLVTPTLYGWVKLAGILVKGNTLKHCLIKAGVEQLIWAPFAYTQFYIGMNLLEGKSFQQCCEILQEKFWPTYKVGLCIWPAVQTINFKFVPEKNRVPFVSVVSFMWNVFLSYMHNRSWKNEPQTSSLVT